MPTFTIETTYHLPVYRHVTIEADSLAQACRRAVEDDDWWTSKRDYDSSGEIYVSGVWEGEDAAYRGIALAVPSHYRETERRKADHFDVLLAVLREPARPMGVSAVEFERWLPCAAAAIAKAEAILGGRRDPEEAGAAGDLTPEDE